MKEHILITLQAPLMAFGSQTIDAAAPTARFPALSALTGLIGNALGYERVDRTELNELQRRIKFAARIERAGEENLSDFQTALLSSADLGWTTWGKPEGRAGAAATYASPALSFREYRMDARLCVALRLEPPGETPTLDDVARALARPARPLYIGRKSCIPAGRLYSGRAKGDTALDALLAAPLPARADDAIAVLWPASDDPGAKAPQESYPLADERNWLTRLHGGGRIMLECALPASDFPRMAGDPL